MKNMPKRERERERDSDGLERDEERCKSFQEERYSLNGARAFVFVTNLAWMSTLISF